MQFFCSILAHFRMQKSLLLLWKAHSLVTRHFPRNWFPGSLRKVGWNASRLKIQTITAVFSSLFQVKNFFRIINLFGTVACKVVIQLFFC